MAVSRFSTKQLEILCNAGMKIRNEEKEALQYQCERLQELIKRYEDGYHDVIADQHEADTYRKKLFELRPDLNVDGNQHRRKSTQYKDSYSKLRTANYHQFWANFHSVRFVVLSLFLLTIGISTLPTTLGGIVPAIGSYLATYDFSAHIIFGVASWCYVFEAVADILITGYSTIRAMLKDRNLKFWDAFSNACKKGDRPKRFQNAIVWTFVNGAYGGGR